MEIGLWLATCDKLLNIVLSQYVVLTRLAIPKIFAQFNYGEFVESWQQSVPDGMTTNLDQLEVKYQLPAIIVYVY